MKKILYSIILLLFVSCSAEWHLHKAIKLNPKYGDSTKITQIIIKQDTIVDTVYVPSHNFEFTLDSLRNTLGSFTVLYSDSFVTISSKLDSLGKIKFQGKVKERLVPFTIIVTDTFYVESKCPPSIVVKEGYPKYYLWVIVAIFVAVILFKFLK